MRYLLVFCLLAAATLELRGQCSCDPIGELQNGERITVTNASELRSAVSNAIGATEIRLADGFYTIGSPIVIDKHGIIIRSASGRRDHVVIRGVTPSPADYAFQVSDGNFVLADLTITDIGRSAVLIQPEHTTGNYQIHNVAFINAGEEMVRAIGPETASMGNVIVECSSFERTGGAISADARGVMVERCDNLSVQDSRFIGIAGGSESAAVMALRRIRDVTVERNIMVDCDRGIVLGDTLATEVDVQGIVIRSNMIKGGDRSGPGIVIANTAGGVVTHNTIYNSGGMADRAIDFAYPATAGVVALENLANLPLRIRMGADPVVMMGNMETATAADFQDAEHGDLHLVLTSPARNAGTSPITPDIDCQELGDGLADIGADEYYPPAGLYDDPDGAGYQITYSQGDGVITIADPKHRSFTAELADMTGRTVRQGNGAGSLELPTGTLPPGAYLLRIRAGDTSSHITKLILSQ